MMNKTLARVSLLLVIAQVLLVILSWLLSAMMTDGVRSLLSSEGIRWFFGSFTAMVGSPVLAGLLVILSAFGSLHGLLKKEDVKSYRGRVAMRTAQAFLLLYVVIFLLLVIPSQGVLRSATGQLFPSAFSRSLVPAGAFAVILFAVVYGLMSGRMRHLEDILSSLSYGIAKGAPLIVLYIFIVQFYKSLCFVLPAFSFLF